jgi:hypothetical protein
VPTPEFEQNVKLGTLAVANANPEVMFSALVVHNNAKEVRKFLANRQI